MLTPVAIISASPGLVINARDNVTFTAVANNEGLSPVYQWKKNGVDMPGATAATYATTTLEDGDQITLEVFSSLSCATPVNVLSNQLVFNVTTTGIANANGLFQDVKLFPNPNNGQFTIKGMLGNQ